MPIRDCPLTFCGGGIYRPMLPINIINPHSGESQRTYGIIDTGADECAIPASYAPLLGHDLLAGSVKTINTGNGPTNAYSHTTKFELYHPATGVLLHTIDDTPIDFMPNLNVVLLGANNFLNKFILTVNYPNKTFSIQEPSGQLSLSTPILS